MDFQLSNHFTSIHKLEPDEVAPMLEALRAAHPEVINTCLPDQEGNFRIETLGDLVGLPEENWEHQIEEVGVMLAGIRGLVPVAQLSLDLGEAAGDIPSLLKTILPSIQWRDDKTNTLDLRLWVDGENIGNIHLDGRKLPKP